VGVVGGRGRPIAKAKDSLDDVVMWINAIKPPCLKPNTRWNTATAANFDEQPAAELEEA